MPSPQLPPALPYPASGMCLRGDITDRSPSTRNLILGSLEPVCLLTLRSCLVLCLIEGVKAPAGSPTPYPRLRIAMLADTSRQASFPYWQCEQFCPSQLCFPSFQHCSWRQVVLGSHGKPYKVATEWGCGSPWPGTIITQVAELITVLGFPASS